MSSELDNLLEKLHSSDMRERVAASIQLMAFGDESVEPLINIVQNENESDLWWLAADTLGHIGDKRAVEPLINLLKSPISFDKRLARKYTAYALARLADTRAVDVLIDMLHERSHSEDEEDDGTITVYDEVDYETIEAAVGALAKIGEWRGIQAVIDRMLEGDFWCDCRVGEWGGESAFQYIVSSLKTDDPERRSTAAALLGEFGDNRAIPILAALLDKEQPEEVRRDAVYGLGQLRTLETFPPLLLTLDDPSEQIVVEAARTISNLIAAGGYAALGKPDLPKQINLAIKQVGEERLITILLNVMNNPQLEISTYGVSFLKTFMPYLTSESVESRVKPALKALMEEQ